jgi:hypothetical protein
MKKILFFAMIAVVIANIFTGCKKDKTLNHTNVSEVKTIYAPADNRFLKLDPGSATIVFEWEQAKAEDNGVVYYEVAFIKEGGDFAKPLYTLTSDQSGLKNTLTITYGDLNKIANMAGIKPEETGKLKWTVLSSKGINVKIGAVSRTLEVERPLGFSEIPVDLYVTGTATEGGDDVTKAPHFKQTEQGVFEIYTKLKAGDFKLVDGKTGAAKVFSVEGNKLVEGGTTAVTGEKVSRIKLNFNTTVATIDEIADVELWFSPEGKTLFSLPYKGAGVWLAENKPIVFRQESWGRDERYKFRFTVKNAAGATTTEYFGSKNSDNSRPDANTAPAYFYVVPVNSSQYDFSFKFNGAADNKNVDVKVDFGAATYTHSVTVK